jgi:hypothetical protein
MDDQNNPSRWWARLLFEPRQLESQEWWLGLVVIGIVLGAAWMIFWPYLPLILANIFAGIFDVLSWLGNLFSGNGSPPPVTTPPPPPDATAIPSPSPSPFPSPRPFVSPSPSPFPR